MLIKLHSFIYNNMLSWVLLTLFGFYFIQIQGTWLPYGSMYCEIIQNDMIKQPGLIYGNAVVECICEKDFHSWHRLPYQWWRHCIPYSSIKNFSFCELCADRLLASYFTLCSFLVVIFIVHIRRITTNPRNIIIKSSDIGYCKIRSILF